jgi:hypothetical protein
MSPDVHCVALKQHILDARQGQNKNKEPSHFVVTPNATSITMPQDYEVPMLFNISFIMNSRFFFLMHMACTTIHEILNKQITGEGSSPIEKTPWPRNVARRWLFPEPADLESGTRFLAAEHVEKCWIDAGLNNEQRVNVIVHVLVFCITFADS